jgi:hypothetical protein
MKMLRAMRFSGALALLAVGAIHLDQYVASGYDKIPTIGPLFLLNGIACAVVGGGLLMPLGRWLSARRADAVVGILAAVGTSIAVLSLIALFISEASTLFGFSENGYRTAIVAAIATEVAVTVLLGSVAVSTAVRLRAATRRDRSRPVASGSLRPV